MRKLDNAFEFIEKVGNRTILGFIGYVYADSLSEKEKHKVADLCHIHGNLEFDVYDFYLADNGKNTNSYNDFLIIINNDEENTEW